MDFIKKYDGKLLDDAGCAVSKEYNNFQNAMKRDLQAIANEIGANMVWYSKGHYDQDAMFERNGKYCYFHYSVIGGYRSKVDLTGRNSFPSVLVRTAAHAKDYRGGHNNHIAYSDVKRWVDNLLNTEHKPF